MHPAGRLDWGFYGWAIVLEWLAREGEKGMYFRSVSPSDQLKMHPWRDKETGTLADEIRGAVKQGTMWRVQDHLVPRLRRGLAAWLMAKNT